ncbi:MAG TPA: helix-turn-helix domain-containing protein [Bacillota bacterium]|nr:helix-turn-helix domain-containing protein [Bacillota bacterium]
MFKVLIIDDEKPVRQAITAMGHWEEFGITQLYEAMEGAGGLAVLREKQPEIVMVDMKMPQMDGVQFLETACREYPRVKYIVISGYDDYEYTRRAIKAKVLDYLLKPVIEAELNEVLRQAVSELNKQWDVQAEPVPQVVNHPLLQPLPLAKENQRYLYEIKNYIDQHYYREISLKVFAERYYLSKEYLSKLFKDEFGYNIYEYLLRIRMAKARELLMDPEVKIVTIAGKLGYHDHNYFSKAFKTYYGMTPTDFREKSLKAPACD